MSLGWSTQLSVIADDRVDSSILTLTQSSIAKSVKFEMQIERDWSDFQLQGARDWKQHFWLQLRERYRLAKSRVPTNSAREAARRQIIRLANIEKAHLTLLAEGEKSGAEWVLILEDDAVNSDVAELSRDLNRNLRLWSDEPQPAYVNLSRSFALDQLQHGGALTNQGVWSHNSRVLSSTIPFTNTVCAVLYRKEFLRELNQELQGIPLEPIVPIDWKINLAIMRLSRKDRLTKGACYTIDPAPIVQGSMLKTGNFTNAG